MSSAIFHLDQSRILSFGNGLNLVFCENIVFLRDQNAVTVSLVIGITASRLPHNLESRYIAR